MGFLDLGNNTNENEMSQADLDFATDPQSSASASYDAAFESTPVGALARMYALREAEDSDPVKLNPKELNEMFPNMPEKFTEPTSRRAAQIMSDRNDERQRLQQVIERGPDDTVSGVTNFAASMLPHIIDPINVAASVATGFAFEGLVGASRIAQMGTASRFGLSVAENFVGNSVADTLSYAAAKQDNSEFSVSDAILNNFVTSAAFPAIGLAGKKVMRYAGLLDPASTGAAYRSMQANVSRGKTISPAVELLKNQMVAETQGKGFRDYTYKAMDHQTPFYMASKEVQADFGKANSAMIGEYHGDGVIYLTDNPNVANGTSARVGAAVAGTIHQVGLRDTNLLDLNQPVPETLHAPLLELLGKDFDPSAPGKEVYQKVLAMFDANEIENGHVINQFNDLVKAQGYDGISYKLESFMDRPHDPHNVAVLFDKSKIEAQAALNADPSAVPKISKGELEEYGGRHTDPLKKLEDQLEIHEPEKVHEIMQMSSEPTPIEPEKYTELRNQGKETMDYLESAFDDLDAADKAEVTKLKEDQAKVSKLPQVFESAKVCMGV